MSPTARRLVRPLSLLVLLAWAFALRVGVHAAMHEELSRLPSRWSAGNLDYFVTNSEMAVALLDEGRWFAVRPSRLSARFRAYEAGVFDPGPWIPQYPEEPLIFHGATSVGWWPEDPGFSLLLAGWWWLRGIRTLVVAREIFLVLDLLAMWALYVAGRRLVGHWLALGPVVLYGQAQALFVWDQFSARDQGVGIYAIVAGLLVVTPPASPRAGRRPAAGVLPGLAMGLVCGTIQLWRSVLTPFGIFLAAAYGLVHGWRRGATFALAYAFSFGAIWGGYVVYARAHTPPTHMYMHTRWQTLLAGLGEFANPWAIEPTERGTIFLHDTVYRPGDEASGMRAYERTFRTLFMDAVRGRPGAYLLVLCQRVPKALGLHGALWFPPLEAHTGAPGLRWAILALAGVGAWQGLRRRHAGRGAVLLVGSYFLALAVATWTQKPVYYLPALPAYLLMAACGLADVTALGGEHARTFQRITARRVIRPTLARILVVGTVVLSGAAGGIACIRTAAAFAVGAPVAALAGYAGGISAGTPVYTALDAVPQGAVLGPALVLLIRMLGAVGLGSMLAETVLGLLATGWLVAMGGTTAWLATGWRAGVLAAGLLLVAPGTIAAGAGEPATALAAGMWLAATVVLVRADLSVGWWLSACLCAAALACRPLSVGLVLVPLAAAAWRGGGRAALKLAGILVVLAGLGVVVSHAILGPAVWKTYARSMGPLAFPAFPGVRATWEILGRPYLLCGGAVLACATVSRFGDLWIRRVMLACLLGVGAFFAADPLVCILLFRATGLAWVAALWASTGTSRRLGMVIATILLIGQLGLWASALPPLDLRTHAAALRQVRQALAEVPGPVFLEEYFTLAPADRTRPWWHGPATRRLGASRIPSTPPRLLAAVDQQHFAAVLYTGTQIAHLPTFQRTLFARYSPDFSTTIPTLAGPRLVTIMRPRPAPAP